MLKNQKKRKSTTNEYVFLNYTNEEIVILLKLLNDIGVTPFNNLKDLKTWHYGISHSSKELNALLNGEISFEDLPLYTFVKNEFFHSIAKWRLKIGK
jgi:hypothetical protein